jgi:hypothetical protein
MLLFLSRPVQRQRRDDDLLLLRLLFVVLSRLLCRAGSWTRLSAGPKHYLFGREKLDVRLFIHCTS